MPAPLPLYTALTKAGFKPSESRNALGEWSSGGGGKAPPMTPKRARLAREAQAAHRSQGVKLGHAGKVPTAGGAWAEWRGMTEAQQRERAEKVITETWSEVASLFGLDPSSLPPLFVFNDGSGPIPNAAAWTTDGTHGPRRVEISRSMVGLLSRPQHRSATAKADVAAAKQVLLHEWCHVFQNPALFGDRPNPQVPADHAEEAAQIFSKYHAHLLWGTPSMSPTGELPYSNLPAAEADLAAAYGPTYWEGAQFSTFYGHDPRTIAV